MTSIKHKTGAEEKERHHSLAMSQKYMDKLYEWSLRVCPWTKVEELPEDHETYTLMLEHFRFRAFGSTGFTVWTR